MSSAWRGWRQAMRMRESLVAAADMASSSRRLRIKSEVFTVWMQYVQVRAQECPWEGARVVGLGWVRGPVCHTLVLIACCSCWAWVELGFRPQAGT